MRYGTRAMLDLANFYGRGPVLLRDIAKRQEISIKYLDRILSTLKAAGLVKALRGAKGGYELNRNPSKITLAQIVKALDGRTELVECVGNRDYCKRINFCIMNDIWSQLSNAIEAMLDSKTLEDLVNSDKNKRNLADSMYFI